MRYDYGQSRQRNSRHDDSLPPLFRKKKKERKIREGLDLGGAQKKVNTPDFPSAKKFVTVLT